MGELALGNFNLEQTAMVPLLFQTGYLTIKEYDPRQLTYTLDYPNNEVKSSLLDALLSAYRDVFPNDSVAVTGDLGAAIEANDLERVMRLLNATIASIPYEHWRADSESIFHIISYLLFKKIGVNIKTEVHSTRGRCDVVILTRKHIYVMELKLNGTALEALEQILSRGYLEPYHGDGRKKIAIGIHFSSEGRKIDDFLVQEM